MLWLSAAAVTWCRTQPNHPNTLFYARSWMFKPLSLTSINLLSKFIIHVQLIASRRELSSFCWPIDTKVCWRCSISLPTSIAINIPSPAVGCSIDPERNCVMSHHHWEHVAPPTLSRQKGSARKLRDFTGYTNILNILSRIKINSTYETGALHSSIPVPLAAGVIKRNKSRRPVEEYVNSCCALETNFHENTGNNLSEKIFIIIL